jgi:phosphatidate cytidylyltransferase
MLRWRLSLGTLLIAALVGLCWLDAIASVPGVWLMPLAIVATVLATREVLDLAALAQACPFRGTVYCGNILVTIGSWLFILPAMVQYGLPLRGSLDAAVMQLSAPRGVLLALSVGIMLVVVGEISRYRKPGGNIANMAAGIFAITYVGLMLSFAIQLRLSCGIGALATWVIVVKMGDTGAYAIGRLIGRHKMAPLISPGKTVEGAVAALAFSCFGSWLAFRYLIPLATPDYVDVGSRWGWIAFGLLVGAAGMVGDLAESLLKRDVGRKDSSDWLPGFGGVLDILDSLLLSAPVAWFCWVSGLVGR